MPVGPMNYEAAMMVEVLNDRRATTACSVVDRVKLLTDLSGVASTTSSVRETFSNLRHGFAAVARTCDVALLGDGEADPFRLHVRPGVETQRAGTVRAGTWTDTGWPATMESAVRSGRTAAAHVLERARDTVST